MQLSEYQRQARGTAIYHRGGDYRPYPSTAWGTLYPALGLASEAGEVAGVVKRVIRDHRGVFDESTRDEASKELGDCLWYLANLASDLGLDLGHVAMQNLAKVRDRQSRGQLHGKGGER